MAYVARIVEGVGPQIGHEVKVYQAGTQTLVEGLLRADSTGLPLDNPFTIQAEVWGFETPSSIRVDIVANDIMLWPDVNIYNLERDVGHGPLKIPRYDEQGRLPGVGTMLRYLDGILQWKFEMEDESEWRNLVYIPVDTDGMQVTTYQPINYFIDANTIDAHLQGIDERLGVIIQAIIDSGVIAYGTPMSIPRFFDFENTNMWGEANTNLLFVDFGETPQGSPSEQTILITNVGSGYLNISQISIVGENAEMWQIHSGGSDFTPIAPEGTHEVVLRYIPSEMQAHSAVLRIASNDPSTPLDVEMYGIGIEALTQPPIPNGYNMHVFGDGGKYAISSDGITWTEGGGA